MSPTVLTYISLGVAVIALVFGIYAVIASGQTRKWRKIFSGNDPDDIPNNLEDIVEKIAQRLKLIDEANDKTALSLEAISKQLDEANQQANITLGSLAGQLNTATQHVGVVRYNGNGDDGGNLSFSAALLDAHQSGIIITSLHGRANSRIYAKIITNGTSEQTLSEEEREALIQAVTHQVN